MLLPDNPFTIERRIDFCDTDAAGLMHFSTYFRFMEAAEAELFRHLGLQLLWQDDQGNSSGFPRIDVQCRFKRPLYFEDLVRTSISIDSIVANRISYRFDFACISKVKNPVNVARGTMVTAFARRTSNNSLISASLPDLYQNQLTSWMAIFSQTSKS